MTWHADAVLLERYADSRVDDVTASSLEAHLVTCADCRSRVASAATPAAHSTLDAIWDEIVDTVDRPRVRWPERALRAIGVSEADARIVITTPGLRAAWLLAIAAVAACAVWATGRAGDDPIVFLWLAPIVPLLGVAAAFGPVTDPMYELSLATPMSAVRLLAVRTIAVTATAAAILVPTSLLMPSVSTSAAAWVLPALAVCTVALACGTIVDPVVAAAMTGAAWLAVVPISYFVTQPSTQPIADELAVFHLPGQLVAAVVTTVAVVVLVRRRDRIACPTLVPGGSR